MAAWKAGREHSRGMFEIRPRAIEQLLQQRAEQHPARLSGKKQQRQAKFSDHEQIAGRRGHDDDHEGVAAERGYVADHLLEPFGADQVRRVGGRSERHQHRPVQLVGLPFDNFLGNAPEQQQEGGRDEHGDDRSNFMRPQPSERGSTI